MANLSEQFEIYLQTGDICKYLNIVYQNITSYGHVNFALLAKKFSLIDEENKANGNMSILSRIFPTLNHQLIVGDCAYSILKEIIHPESYKNYLDDYHYKYSMLSPYTFSIIIPIIFAIISTLLNLSLVFVSATKIFMAKICNFLIIFDSICQCLVLLPYYINFFAYIFGIRAIDYRICLFVEFLTNSCSYAAFMAIFFISLERLLIFMFPLRMHCIGRNTNKICVVFSILICLIFGTSMSLTFFNVQTGINAQFFISVLCSSHLYGEALHTNATIIVLLFSMLNYFLIFACILWRKYRNKKEIQTKLKGNEKENLASKEQSRMFRSLFLICFFILIGWMMATFIARQACMWLRGWTDSLGKFYFPNDASAEYAYSYNLSTIWDSMRVCIYVAFTGINAPILNISSFEYRRAFKEIFCRNIFKRKTTKISAVGPLFVTATH